jgi:hypothetical protein
MPINEESKQKPTATPSRHDFTGQSLLLTPDEKNAYETHCISYVEQFQPATYEETDLIQQYADLRWTLHQVSVQQSNLLSLTNAISAKLIAAGDLETIAATLAPLYKSLNALSTYENRRRRAADETLARFNELAEARRQQLAHAVQLYKAHKTNNQPFNPADFGFVCSSAQIEKDFHRSNRLTEARKLLASHLGAAKAA